MRTEPISRELHSDRQEPNDIQLLMHAAWLLAGVAIAMAGCTVTDEADLHAAATPEATQNVNVAHLAPQTKDSGGNVQDMTY